MVNSESMDSPGDGKAKDCVTQLNSVSVGSLSPSPVTASTLCLRKMDFSNETGDITNSDCCGNSMDALPESAAITGNEEDEDDDEDERTRLSTTEKVSSLYCSVPLNKVRDVLNTYAANPNGQPYDVTKTKKLSRKLLCLYCDRTFVTTNLRQKHVVRCHSVKQARRSSSRFQQPQSTTACIFCNKLNNVEHNLKQLFKHLVEEHSSKYFACPNCEERFLFKSHLEEHNLEIHNIKIAEVPDVGEDKAKNSRSTEEKPKLNGVIIFHDLYDAESSENQDKEKTNLIKSKHKTKIKKIARKNDTITNRPNLRMGVRKELRKKKVGVKSTKAGVKRNTRLQAKITQSKTNKKRPKTNKSEKVATKAETSEKSSSSINPYPTFDAYFRVKKITDHSIDNLKISSLTFDDVFDKAFYNRIKCNIQENLQNHIDGKLFKNEESESRISNFEKMQEVNNSPSENFGCDISLNAATPVVSLLSTQFGEDLESQIEYGSKASKKKPPPKKDEIHYKYFTRRKYQASILESKENRDLSKLDMWTQLIVKNRQQNIINEKKTDKEKLEYTKGNEYRTKMQNEELDRILDRRGPFEDLKEEANKKAAQEKLNRLNEDVNCEAISDVTFILNDMLDSVFHMYSDDIKTEAVSIGVEKVADVRNCNSDKDCEVPFYLKLRRASSADEPDIDKSDRITLICSSQETENFEESNVPRDKNSLVELTGEWARTRIYICAACGVKVANIKLLIDHKSMFHQNTWVQHYEFVGNQSELYKHLSIPGLGKVGYVEEFPMSKTWGRSGARMCTKCSKTCNSLSELHRHILECGEDWSWMLARRKLKYRPFGAKSRRKRRGLVKRIINKEKAGDEVREKKKYNIKRIDGPRQKPSDAETIQRMLANLPAKRATRKLISLKDGFPRTIKRKAHTSNAPETSIKSKSKLIVKKNKKSLQSREHVIQTNNKKKGVKCNPIMLRKSVRNINKVFGTKLLDTNSTLLVKRKLKNVFQHQRITRSKNLSNNAATVETAIKTETGKQTFLNKVKMLSKAVSKGVLKNKTVKSTEIKCGDENNDNVAKSKRPTRKLQTSLKKTDDESTENYTKETVIEGVKTDPKTTKNGAEPVDETAEKKESKKPESNGYLETNKKESLGTKFFRTLSLRRLKKTKSESESRSAPDSGHKENNSKVKTKNGKRKSALSFRNAFKKIKLKERKIANIVQVDGSSQISDEIPKILPFLENIHINDHDDSIDAESETVTQIDSKPVMNGANEFTKPNTPVIISEPNPTDAEILPNVVVKQEVLYLENQNNNHLIPNVEQRKPAALKVTNKTKIKKRVKGLNDCIAMLTSKLQQKVEDREPSQPLPDVTTEKQDVTTHHLENEPKQLLADSEIISKISNTNLPHIELTNEANLTRKCENIFNNCENNLKIYESNEEELETNFASKYSCVTECENTPEVTEKEDLITNNVDSDIEEAAQTSKINKILTDAIENTQIIESNDKLCTNTEQICVDSFNIQVVAEDNCKSKTDSVENNLEEIDKLIFESANLKLLETSLDISEIKLHENHGTRQNLATLKFEEIVSQNDLAILMDKFNDVDIKNKFKEVDVNIEIDIMKCLENVADNVITIADKQKQFKKRVKSHLKRKQNHRINSIRKFNNKRKENIDIVANEATDVKCMVEDDGQIENDLGTTFIENGEIILDNEYLNDNEVNFEVDITQKDGVCPENVSEHLIGKEEILNGAVTHKHDDCQENNGNPETNESSPLMLINHLDSLIINLPKIDAKIENNKSIKKKGKKTKQTLPIENINSMLIEEHEPDILENKLLINVQSSESTPIKHIDKKIEDNVLVDDEVIQNNTLQKSETDSEDEVPLASLIKTNDVTAPIDLIEETIENVVINYIDDDSIVEKKTVEKKKKNLAKKRKSSIEKKHILLLEEAIDSNILNTEIDDFENVTQCKSKLKISCKIFQKKNKSVAVNNKKIQCKKPEKNIEEKIDDEQNIEETADNIPKIEESAVVQKIEELEKITEPVVNETPFEGVLVIKQETLQIPKEAVPDNDMVNSLELEIRRQIQLSNQLLQLQTEENTEESFHLETEKQQEDDKVAKLCKELEETVENISNLKIINSEEDDANDEQQVSGYEEFQIDREQIRGTNRMKLCRKKVIVNGEEDTGAEKRKAKKNQKKHTNNIKKKSRIKKLIEQETVLQTNLIEPAPVDINMMDTYEDVNMEIEDFQIDSPIQIGRGGQICASVYKTLNKEENIFEIQNAEIGRKLTINKKKILKPDFQEQHKLQSEDLRNNFMLDLRYQQNIEDIGKMCFDFENIDEQNEIEIEKQLESIATQNENGEPKVEPPIYLNEPKLQKKKSKKSKNKVDSGTLADENECQDYSNLKITIDLSDINNISAFNTNHELTKVKKKKKHILSLDIDSNPSIKDIDIEIPNPDNTFDLGNLVDSVALNGENTLDLPSGVSELDISKDINQDGPINSIDAMFIIDTSENKTKETNDCIQPSFVIPVLNEKIKKVKKNRKQKCVSPENNEIIQSFNQSIEEEKSANLLDLNESKILESTNTIRKLPFKTKGGARKSEKKKRSTEQTQNPGQLYCEICDRYFARCDNLLKHKRTLTHIAKLSEIEAKEAAAKNNIVEQEEIYKMDINISDILNKPEKEPEHDVNNEIANKIHVNSPFMLKTNSDTLKLADIINDVLNKPVNDETIKQTFCESSTLPNPIVKETKRYKSLGERKSFESDLNTTYTFNNRNDEISTPKLSNTDSILKHQISMLENIIENQGPFGYIDDLSISSNKSMERLSGNSELSALSETKQDNLNQINFTHTTNIINSLIKPAIHSDNFIKPTQYEEISNDSSSIRNNFDDQRSRKVLNRDEELFLECCSLLKSSSEVSSYSKRSSKTVSVLNNFEILKPSDEPDWLEGKRFVVKNQEFRNGIYSNSCPNTPLGDGFGDNYSNTNSNTITTDWNNKQPNFTENPAFEDISDDSKNSALSNQKGEEEINQIHHNENNFSDVFGEEINISVDEHEKVDENDIIADQETIREVDEDLKKKMVSRFDGLMAKALKNSLQVVTKSKNKKKQFPEITQTSITDYAVALNPNKMEPDIYDSKKMLTKGAMKVFEGLKVSIPTDDLDIKELLNGTFGPENELKDQLDPVIVIEEPTPELNDAQSPKETLKKFGNKLGLKVTKNIKPSLKDKDDELQCSYKKSHDVYDFEETQDNTDIFNSATFTNLTAFRNQIAEMKNTNEPVISKDAIESDSESNRYIESFNFEAQSVSSFSTESTISLKKPKQKNITKNKCMIMGRIFKNAFKSKIEDDIRDIPTVENTKLVEDYVKQLPEKEAKKNKMSEHEMNLLFDKLLQEKDANLALEKEKLAKIEEVKIINGKTAPKLKKAPIKRKRPRHNSDSTDDEFNLNKSRKRYTKKKHKNVDDTINLEQELKECIGVASRKSQRKCTSGKQNVLVEFWSSDESVFEAMLFEDVVVKPPVVNIIEEVFPSVAPPCVALKESTLQPEIVIETTAPPSELEKPKASKMEKATAVRRKSTMKHNRNRNNDDNEDRKLKHIKVTAETLAANRRKRAAADTLYYWSSSSEDESQDLIEIKPIRDEVDEDDDRPMQHGWIVGDSPKKLVTMLAQAKGKKVDAECVKEQGKKRTTM